jgi:serine O-acetyltransferase
MTPERIWWLSTRAHRRGFTPLAKSLKALNRLVYSTVLPYEADIQPDVVLWHHGLGVVIHPATTIGSGVRIGHNVTIAAGGWQTDTPFRVTVGDGATLGAGCAVIAKEGHGLTVGAGAVVGANAVVTRDAPTGAVMAGPPATNLRDHAAATSSRAGQRP